MSNRDKDYGKYKEKYYDKKRDSGHGFAADESQNITDKNAKHQYPAGRGLKDPEWDDKFGDDSAKYPTYKKKEDVAEAHKRGITEQKLQDRKNEVIKQKRTKEIEKAEIEWQKRDEYWNEKVPFKNSWDVKWWKTKDNEELAYEYKRRIKGLPTRSPSRNRRTGKKIEKKHSRSRSRDKDDKHGRRNSRQGSRRESRSPPPDEKRRGFTWRRYGYSRSRSYSEESRGSKEKQKYERPKRLDDCYYELQKPGLGTDRVMKLRGALPRAEKPAKTYDVYTISNLLQRGAKNPISLLHEYCQKIKKDITYQYDLQDKVNDKLDNVYICTIMIESMGILSRGSAKNKKDARQSAGEKAQNFIIHTYSHTRSIIGDLLEKQCLELEKLNESTQTNNSSNQEMAQELIKLEVNSTLMNPSQVLFQAQDPNYNYPRAMEAVNKDVVDIPGKVILEPLTKKQNGPFDNKEFMNQIELQEDDKNILTRMNLFTQSLGQTMHWNVKEKNTLRIIDLKIGQWRSSSSHRKKKLGKILAVKNLLKQWEKDPNMKQKMLDHLFDDDIGQPLTDTSTNVKIVSKIRNIILKHVNLPKKERENTKTRVYEEPQEVNNYFNSLNNTIQATDDQIITLTNTFEEIAELLQYTLQSNKIQLIPVGSFLIGSIRKLKLAVDSYLHLDQAHGSVSCYELVQLFELRRQRVDVPSPLFYSYSLSLQRDGINREEYVQFTNRITYNHIRVFIITPDRFQEGASTLNHYTTGLYHSNWVVQNLSDVQNDPQTLRLFRIVREWKDQRYLTFLPSEILDVTLSYATFSFKENNIFKVLLRFFTLLTMMLCAFNKNFYELSDYHQYLIDSIPTHHKDQIIEAAQSTFVNLSQNNTIDFIKTGIMKDY